MLYTRILNIYSLVSIDTLVQTLKVFVTYLYKCQSISWHDRANVRILSDGEVSTHRMPYINIVWYYWRYICRYGKFILYVTFITLIYLTDQQEEGFKGFWPHKARKNITVHKSWKQHKSNKILKGVIKTKVYHPPEENEPKKSTEKQGTCVQSQEV